MLRPLMESVISDSFERSNDLKGLGRRQTAPLPVESTEVLNMRTQTADEIVANLLDAAVTPNLNEAPVVATPVAEK